MPYGRLWSIVLNRKLLTAEGYQRLQDELNYLVRKDVLKLLKLCLGQLVSAIGLKR